MKAKCKKCGNIFLDEPPIYYICEPCADKIIQDRFDEGAPDGDDIADNHQYKNNSDL